MYRRILGMAVLAIAVGAVAFAAAPTGPDPECGPCLEAAQLEADQAYGGCKTSAQHAGTWPQQEPECWDLHDEVESEMTAECNEWYCEI